MDPNLNDPNNHVPPVAPEDAWDDLDGSQNQSIPGLPPLRPYSGILPRKTAKKLHVNHHAPKPKIQDHRFSSPAGQRIAKGKDDGGSFQKPENAYSEEPEEPGETAASEPSSQTASAQDEAGEVERISLPTPPDGKRHRVNEIGSVIESAPQRTATKYSHSGAGTGRKEIRIPGKRRKVFSRKRQGEWSEKSARGSIRWMLYTGLGVVALVGVAVVLNRPAAGNKAREQSMFSQMKPEESGVEIGEEDEGMLAMLTEGQEEAKRIFATYATAGSPADFISSLHRAEEMAGLIERSWKPLGAKAGWKPDDQAIWTVREHEGLHYGTLEGTLPDFSVFRAFFRKGGEGLKMDWKATVGYVSTDFATLKKGQGDGGEVRAWISPADFHTFPLPEGTFRSFRLSSPDGQQTLWGYVKSGGELDGKLIAEFAPSQITGEAQKELPVILGLERGPADSLPNQWMITKLVRLNWLDE